VHFEVLEDQNKKTIADLVKEF